MGRCHVFNWQASGIEARANIAIFTNDRASFDEAVGLWPKRARSSLYLTKDGAVPLSHSWCPKQGEELIKDWFGQRTFADGHAQETCRDLEHTAYGLAALINVAETARIQDVDLYGSEKERVMTAMEYHAKLKNRSSVPEWVCGGILKGDLTGTMEVGYNHYVGREGNELPETSAWLNARRPMKGYFHYLWETMTHAQTAPLR
jgi:Alginate lyase